MAASQVDLEQTVRRAAEQLGLRVEGTSVLGSASFSGSGNSQSQTSKGAKKRANVTTPAAQLNKKTKKVRRGSKPVKLSQINSPESSAVEDYSDGEEDKDVVEVEHHCPEIGSGCRATYKTVAEVDAHHLAQHSTKSSRDPATVADWDHLIAAIHQARGKGARQKLAKIPSQPLLTARPSVAQHHISNKQQIPQSNQRIGYQPASTSPPEIAMFPCTYCKKVYGTSADLVGHVKKHHASVESVTLPCPHQLCFATFIDTQGVMDHLQAHHGGHQRASQVPLARPIDSVAGVDRLLSGLSLRQDFQPQTSHNQGRENWVSYPTIPEAGYWNPEASKSGQDRTSSKAPRVPVVWPHEAFDSILGKKHYTYSSLTFPALMAGQIKAMIDDEAFQGCPEKIRHMAQHLSLLAHAESVTNDTLTTKEFNRSILMNIESGEMSWSDKSVRTYEQLKVHFLAGLRPSSQKVHPKKFEGGERQIGNLRPYNVRKEKAVSTVCRDYGDGKCPETEDHGADKQHVCFTCLLKRERVERHPRTQCTGKKQ